jgi:hypothetical protein
MSREGQPRLGQGTAIHRRARQIVIRDGEDLSFGWETAEMERRSRSFAVLLLISRSKKLHLPCISATAIPNLVFTQPLLASSTKISCPTHHFSPSTHHINFQNTTPPLQNP